MHENRLPDIHVLPHIWNEMYIAGEKMYQHTKHHGLLHAFSDIHLKKEKSTGHLLHLNLFLLFTLHTFALFFDKQSILLYRLKQYRLTVLA